MNSHYLKTIIILALANLLCACATETKKYSFHIDPWILSDSGVKAGHEGSSESVRLESYPERAKVVLTRILPGGRRKTTQYRSPCELVYHPSDWRVYMVVSSPFHANKAIDLKKVHGKEKQIMVKLEKMDGKSRDNFIEKMSRNSLYIMAQR
jgi:hypothetical protein